MRNTKRPALSLLDSSASPVSRKRLGMSIAVSGSVHSSTSVSPGASLVSTLRALSAGRGQRNPRRSSVCSAMHGHEHASAGRSRARACTATGGEDFRIALWRPGREDPDAVLDGHGGPVVALAAAPDGKWLASASWDRTLRVWPLAGGGGAPRLLEGHQQNVNGVAFLPDG